MMIPEKAIAFFWRRVAKGSTCWLWIGGISPNGYGTVCVDAGRTPKGKQRHWAMSAHRLSWILHQGPISVGLQVMHRCDIKTCVNPDHLELGTARQNVRDAIVRGLKPIGERTYQAKLTEKKVREARRLFFSKQETNKSLAARFGVNTATMHEAIHGKTWKHLEKA